MNYINEMLEFIKASPSCFHAVANITAELEKGGFKRLSEGEKWELCRGESYYVTRNGSAVIAFTLPSTVTEPRFSVVASHSDSPTFKVKELPELDGVYTRINTERYGGMIYDSWIDRPLSVAGRVIVRTEGGIESRLVNVDRDLLMIPHVAIHMENSNNGKTYDPASDLVPLYGGASAKGSFMKAVCEAAKVSEDELVSHDIYLYNRQPYSVWGVDGEFISSPKLDDLACAYTSVKALLAAEKTDSVPVMYVADNEEVGSGTRQGAASTFLYDTLSRICDFAGGDIRIAAAKSVMLSADNAHAVHPNKGGLADPTHRPVMNGGVVLKFNAAQHYTTDGISAALVKELCRKADVPLQLFTNRSDMRGGSTLGNISAANVPLLSADIGIAQLAMHSSYETCGANDVERMISLMREFFSASLNVTDGGITFEQAVQ